MESSRGKIAFGDWLRWYGGVLALALVVAVGAHVVFGIHPLRAVFGYCGLPLPGAMQHATCAAHSPGASR